MGYNPINGESYATKDGLNSKVEEVQTTENGKESNEVVQSPKEEKNGEQLENDHSKEGANGHAQQPTEPGENGNAHVPAEKPTNGANGHSAAKVR